MPISREEFQLGSVDLSLPIAHILRTRPDLAFTIQELLVLLGETVARITGLEEVEQALDSLVSQGIVEVKELEGQRWYTVIGQGERRLGFLRE